MAERFDWITVEATPPCTANQHPSYHYPLFEAWTAAGWEIVSVTPFDRTSSMHMCRAIGVLKRLRDS